MVFIGIAEVALLRFGPAPESSIKKSVKTVYFFFITLV